MQSIPVEMSSQGSVFPLKSTSSSLSTLPVYLRRKIYNNLGAVINQKVFICASCNYLSVPRPCGVFNLIRTSRFFYDEISSIVYTENRFSLLVEGSTDLRFLLNLRPPTVAKLRGLCVELKLRIFQINGSIRSDQIPFLHDWLNTLAYLFRHVEPKKLGFSLKCDISDPTIVKFMIQPFRKHQPSLASCAIKFPYIRCGSLNRLTELAVLRATRYSRSSNPFRFLDLPTEVRFAILEYTDLVAPHKEIYWNERDGFFILTTIHPTHHMATISEADCACSETEKSRISRLYAYVSIVEDTRCARPTHDTKGIRCYSPLHVDQDIPAWEQRRWESPQCFFLVCRSMRDEAEMVFWRENRIILTPRHGCHTLSSDNIGGFGLPKFMAILRPSALRALRMLEIVMPPIHNDYCPVDSDELEDWAASFHNLRQRGNLATLTLRIYVTHMKRNAWVKPFVRYSPFLTSDEDYAKQISRIKLILRPLSKFQSLNHSDVRYRSRPYTGIILINYTGIRYYTVGIVGLQPCKADQSKYELCGVIFEALIFVI